MKLSKEIIHNNNLNRKGKHISREAVRGIILNGDKIYLIFSSKNGDYFFPGGGVEEGETFEEALKREVMEECGALLTRIIKKIGMVTEYDKPKEDNYDFFKMISYYYICEVEEDYRELSLEDYEKELGLKPVWINLDEAIKNNIKIMKSNTKEIPRWIKRETYVLEHIKNHI